LDAEQLLAEIQNAFGVVVKYAASRPEGLDSIGGY
jgi:hypothetical protein